MADLINPQLFPFTPMLKRLLLATALFSAALHAQAQKPQKRLRGQALIDSLQGASRASTQKYLDILKESHEKDEAAKKALDDKNGFRTYHFGETISQHPELLMSTTLDSNTKIYTNPKENNQVGESALESVSYVFYKDQLYRILIQTKGISNSTFLRKALEAQYGSGYQSNKYIEEYYWFGKVVTLHYQENALTHDADVFYSSKTLTAQREADKKEAAKKAGSDL